MKEKSLTFNSPMVRAILEGRKTQTRIIVDRLSKHGRITEFQRSDTLGYDWTFRNKKLLRNDFTNDDFLELCPYGQPGDRLWVREKFKTAHDEDNLGDCIEYADGTKIKPVVPDNNTGFRFSWDCDNDNVRWRPAIHMPRWASRISLEITGVRVERLQDISEDDAIAEGVKNSLHLSGGRFANENYAHLWWSIHGDGAWDKNPWVWVVEFKRA